MSGRCGACGMDGADPDHSSQPHVFEPERHENCPMCGAVLDEDGVRAAEDETLALIAEHRMDLAWTGDGRVRAIGRRPGPYVVTGDLCPTISDAVRACVQRIKSAGDGRGTE